MSRAHKGVAPLWQCDILGHLITRFYVAIFDNASYQYVHTMFGWAGGVDPNGRLP